MPITWSQVRPGLDPSRYTIRTVPALIARSKAWEGYEDAARPVVKAIELLSKREAGGGRKGGRKSGSARGRSNHSARL